jgi:hypothetical protein
MSVSTLISQLPEKDRKLLAAIIILFYKKINGYGNRLVSGKVLELLREEGHDINDAHFRDILGIIRRDDSCTKYLKKYHQVVQHAFIVSSNEGYWWTEDLKEMKTFWESQHGRVCEIMSNSKPLYKLFGYHEDQLQIIEFINQKNKSIA